MNFSGQIRSIPNANSDNLSTMNDSLLFKKLDGAIPFGRSASNLTGATIFVDGGLMQSSSGF